MACDPVYTVSGRGKSIRTGSRRAITRGWGGADGSRGGGLRAGRSMTTHWSRDSRRGCLLSCRSVDRTSLYSAWRFAGRGSDKGRDAGAKEFRTLNVRHANLGIWTKQPAAGLPEGSSLPGAHSRLLLAACPAPPHRTVGIVGCVLPETTQPSQTAQELAPCLFAMRTSL